ncbi:MAG: PD-(D/E)XK nuclease family protein [Lachnospiraceae bacterium]|nr:PD-(D/E)XK nuclease family protein [Lachnospiraceae bacterium]
MSLQFYIGEAGSGKSWKLNHDLINWSIENPHKKFLMIVPDQFTMHTQMELCKLHPNRGILNIEVLSFGRLSHRIFEEVGKSKLAILDDTGKNLILRKITADIVNELPIIGRNLNKPGYINEVKSAISEFMQYAISPAELRKIIAYSEKKGALSAKLNELHRIYEAFLEYIHNEYITTEETLDLLRLSLNKSQLIRDSVIVFDGFTGFTPLQNRVIQELLMLSERVIVSVLMGREEYLKRKPLGLLEFSGIKEQALFYLTGKMVNDLLKLTGEIKIKRLPDVMASQDETPKRFAENPEMAHLEKCLFRYPLRQYNEATEAINITEAASIKAEVREVFTKIKELTMNYGYSYREIAIITGDMNEYASYLEREASKFGIPIYLDQTKGILLNPFTEFIRAALKVIIKNYNYEAVFHFLRSGFTELTFAEVDRLENYVIGCGIKGKKKFHAPFTRSLSKWPKSEFGGQLSELNQIREKVIKALEPLEQNPKTAGDIVKVLYEFIVAGRIQQKLKVYEENFTRNDDLIRAKEYAQIYRLVITLLDQIYALLKDEPMSLREFADIFDAGLSEIKIGTIPQNIDRVVIGDIERTRLNQVRALFFLGVNDGNIPVGNSRGGLISDLDREFLKESAWELSPTPRQKMYIQRLYLYMNMTKPSERLYLSYARVDSEGKSLRPSYLIDVVKKLFPSLKSSLAQEEITFERIFGMAESLDAFAISLRKYAAGRQGRELNNTSYEIEDKNEAEINLPGANFTRLTVLGKIYQNNEEYAAILNRLINKAFSFYDHLPLTKAVADLLYGSLMNNSVSRLEKYAGCAYAHFLQYGLLLSEREEYTFEAVDLGIIYHGVLEIFAGKLAEHHLSWFDFSDEEGEKLLREAVDNYAAQYGETILFGSARNEQIIGRIFRIMLRTVKTLRKQLQAGEFLPEQFEVSFSHEENLAAANILISPEEEMTLRGQIDRIDICETEKEVYVKVIDYKSGHKTFNLADLYHGIKLQLVVYLNVALEKTQKSHPGKEVIPAAVLYYHVSDPMLSDEADFDPLEADEKIFEKLKMTGLVNDDEEIIRLLDRDFTTKSKVIPVARKKDGEFTSNSGILSREDFTVLKSFAASKIKAMGQQIKAGDITKAPYENKELNGCTYCNFKNVCGFDPRIPGYQTRKLPELPREEVLKLMREF